MVVILFLVFMWAVTIFAVFWTIGTFVADMGGKGASIAFTLVLIGISYYWTMAIVKRHPVSVRKAEDLLYFLSTVGVKASFTEKRFPVNKIGSNAILGRRCEVIIELDHENIQYISITTEMNNAWGINYYFNYLVRSQGLLTKRKRLSHDVTIMPLSNYGYVRIKYPAEIPSREQYEEIERLAKDIQSGTLQVPFINAV